MFIGFNESKSLTKHISREVGLMEQNVIQNKNGIMINVGVRVKNIIYVKKIIFGILLHVVAKNGKYLANVMDDVMKLQGHVAKK